MSGETEDGAGGRLEVFLPAAPDAPREARRALDEVAGAPDDLGAQVALLVSELVTNSVRHGGLRDADAIRLAARATARGVRIEVEDPGGGFDPERRGEERGELPTGGYGLRLVEELADRWGVERDGGTRVWFEIDARGSRPSA